MENIFIEMINQPWMLILWLLALIGFILQLWVVWVSFGRLMRERLSQNLQLNIFYWLVYCSFICTYQSYVFWCMICGQANFYFLFYLGIGMAGFGAGLSLSITFLMLERVLIIARSSTYNRHHTKFVTISLGVCGGTTLFVMISNLIRELPLSDQLSDPSYVTPSYIMKNGSAIINDFLKIGIAGLNIFVSALFLLILYRYLNGGGRSKNDSTHKLKKANLLVLFIVISEFIFVISPRCLEVTCFWASWGICKLAYMGFMVELDAIFTAIIYLLILKPKKKRGVGVATGHVTTVNSNFKS